MLPSRPVTDVYDNHYQISPHFKRTPGLTVIPPSSPNFDINRRLKRKISALYRKYGLERCPNYGLFWAGWPQWTMISDRDKMVLLVMELKEKDIKSWYKIDKEVHMILAEPGMTEPGLLERGVCVRYYEFWEDREDKEDEERDVAAQIPARELAAEQNLQTPAQSEGASTQISEILGLLGERERLVRTGRVRRASMPRFAELRPRQRSLRTQELRERLEAGTEELPPWILTPTDQSSST